MNRKFISYIFVLLFGVVLFQFIKKPEKHLKFEDIHIIEPAKYVELVTPFNYEVKRIADRVKEPIKAYYYVRDVIEFDPSMPVNTPENTIKLRKGNCLSKAVLLVSLYRALGIPEEHVRIIVGELLSKGMIIEHAWVEVKYYGTWLQQDTTDLIGVFEFGQFNNREYFDTFVRKENFCFNDTGFAVVSQRNRLR